MTETSPQPRPLMDNLKKEMMGYLQNRKMTDGEKSAKIREILEDMERMKTELSRELLGRAARLGLAEVVLTLRQNGARATEYPLFQAARAASKLQTSKGGFEIMQMLFDEGVNPAVTRSVLGKLEDVKRSMYYSGRSGHGQERLNAYMERHYNFDRVIRFLEEKLNGPRLPSLKMMARNALRSGNLNVPGNLRMSVDVGGYAF